MRIEPHLDNKPKETTNVPILRAEPLGHIVLSKAPKHVHVTAGPPRLFKYLVGIACAFVAWVLWGFVSASLFVSALNRGDRNAVETYVDRAALVRSIEALSISGIERQLGGRSSLLASAVGIAIGEGVKLIPTMDLLRAVIPTGSSVRMISPYGLTAFLVTIADPQRRGAILIFTFRDLSWRLSGIANM